jgi:tetratricopeptide (TPR) repeat protein
LKKFKSFVSTVFPSEAAFVRDNNEMRDADLLEVIDKIVDQVMHPEKEIEFDESVNPRKYSRIIKSFETKLAKIDVDKYYEWISRINYLITTDAIPPEEQTRILRETESFTPGWFHAESFFRAMENYEGYLLIRYREKDYKIVRKFLESHREAIETNREIDAQIKAITEKMVLEGNIETASLEPLHLRWLDGIFHNETLSKKTRYQALLMYNMHHINIRSIANLLEPMAELEGSILKGEYYSRRIVANFYANKLLILNYLGKYQQAAFCGLQSIKHHTEDYLYYLNNYSSVLMHLERYSDALEQMQESFPLYKSTRDKSRRLIFVSNYCRCLNKLGNFQQSARLAESYLDEIGNQVFTYRWNYFFRVFFSALYLKGQSEKLLRIEKKFNLAEKERKSGFLPYIALLRLGASYQEMKVAEKVFQKQLATIKQEIKGKDKAEMRELLRMIENAE